MRSVRLGEDLDARLMKAVKTSGLPASQIIREGVEERVSHLLGDTVAARLAPFIGKVASGKRVSARNHKQEYAQLLDEKFSRKTRRVAG